MAVPEAPLERTEHGLVPAGEGWFVLNAREARWDEGALGRFCNFEGEPRFPQVGLNLSVLEPGQPMCMYHRERNQEDFLVLAGEALLVIEGEERPLRAWDVVHCPPDAAHAIVGGGAGPCLVVAVGTRAGYGEGWGAYTVEEAALARGAGVEQETTRPQEAYARFPKDAPAAFRQEWLPL